MAQNFAKTGRNIICIGRNYVNHAKELGNKVPTEPFYFLKPTSSYLEHGNGKIEIPKGVMTHHEGEKRDEFLAFSLVVLNPRRRWYYCS